MFPPQLDYHRTHSIEEALDLLGTHADSEPAIIAGGQGLIQSMKLGDAAPEVLIDVSNVDELVGVGADKEGVTVGALTTHAEVIDSEAIREQVPLLAEAAEQVGDIQIRNRGTLGGNLAEADSGADLPAAVLAADATIHARGPDGERTIPSRDFFVGREETTLGADELLTAVYLPTSPEASAYVRKTHPATGYAMVGVAVNLETEEESISAGRVAVTGATEHAVRLSGVEEALAGTAVGEVDVSEVAARADLPAEKLVGDPHASGEFRARLAETYVGRALETALGRA